ncbi:molybdenum cofactor guanylyltransferase [Microcoleus sp. FACHB-672]|uniref:molybdenum cofactor guanylyltransferase n=1 Tax=Microcoleus sp. FACHB-672 TaxID=2692825 RepID=UPI0016898454|nr:molybdenum cofactor guanylyltransferase [Microcoleus sp. FACHB-672]MBD2041685.1 molybdenum cofactor guanylyltransferase [Microcoleus sp. FACHB-672]
MQVEKSDQGLSAIVLAGGQSSRMGRDKALIAPQGVPLLKQVYEIAVKCASPVYVVTPWPERYQDILPNSCRFIREVPLADETEPHGPLVGLAQGLTQVETQWVLVLACDLPRLQVEVLQSWIGLLDDVKDDAIALLPRDAKGWQPLCGFYRHSCLPALTGFINQGGRSFQRWLSQYPVQEVPVSDRQMLFNCNTPTDLEQVKGET